MLLASGAVFAQSGTTPADKDKDANTTTVIVSGQRAALESASQIKKNSDEIVDSIVAADIGKLPDRSVTEVLQRIPGVSIDRTQMRADPLQSVGDGHQRFAAEGTGVSVRGMNYVRSELNGRDSFSANGGRALSFEDVPPELMAGVDVYKNPSAEQIEGRSTIRASRRQCRWKNRAPPVATKTSRACPVWSRTAGKPRWASLARCSTWRIRKFPPPATAWASALTFHASTWCPARLAGSARARAGARTFSTVPVTACMAHCNGRKTIGLPR
jgi:hypothetical protein